MPRFILLVCIACAFNNFAFAQNSNIDWARIKFKTADSTQVYVYDIHTSNGSVFVGEVVKIRNNVVVISTSNIGEIEVPIDEIVSLKLRDGNVTAVKPSLQSKDMVGAHHYMIFPSAYNLKKGEFNFQDTQIFFPSASLGITDFFMISAGFSFFPGVEFGNQMYYVMPKLGFNLSPKLRMSLQYSKFFTAGSHNPGFLNGIISYGHSDNHISVGFTKIFLEDDVDGLYRFQGLNIASTMRLGGKAALLLEFYAPTTDDPDAVTFFMPGVRILNGKSAFDIGFFIPFVSSTGFPFPYINYTLRF